MTKFIIIVAILQIILSIILVAREKNEIANVSEIISSFILFNYLNAFSFEETNILWKNIGLTLIEYFGVKVFLVIFMIIARIWSFYEIKALYSKKKKYTTKSKKLKIIRAFSKVKYWPRLKLGLPSMAGKVHPKTKVRFDKKGFPKFKTYYVVILKRKYFKRSREKHFYMANKILYRNLNKAHRLNLSFEQIELLSQGETPNGYTWHHHQDAGVLQLVDSEVHSKTSHIGGFSIWGEN